MTAPHEKRVTRACRCGHAGVIEMSRALRTMLRMTTADAFVAANLPPPQRCLRIAVVTETWPPEVNGVAVTLAQLVDGLRRRQHDVQLVRTRQDGRDAPGGEPRLHEVLMRGLPIPRYPHLRMGVPCKRALVRLWSLQRPDVVHIATEGPLGWSALHAARHLKLPLTSDFRTNFHAYSAHYGIGWLRKPILAYLRRFHNATQCTMVPTEAQKRELEAAGLRGISVVARGVDVQRFAPQRRSVALRRQWGASDDDLVVTCVGRVAAEKNLDTAAAAFNAIRGAQPRARLVVVGNGPYRDALRSQCPDALFAGQRSGDDLAAHYASADLLLFPSLTETFGNATTEAMASGLCVVAFDRAAAAQLIRSGDNGMLAAPHDRAGFIEAALNAAGDSARRRAMGAQARATVASMSWAAITACFEAVLLGVLREHDAIQARGQPVLAGHAIG